MNIEESIEILKNMILMPDGWIIGKDYKGNLEFIGCPEGQEAIETLLTAYEKEKEKNKKAIDFINERKKTVNKDMAEGTRLQVGTFMWQVDELLEILKEE